MLMMDGFGESCDGFFLIDDVLVQCFFYEDELVGFFFCQFEYWDVGCLGEYFGDQVFVDDCLGCDVVCMLLFFEVQMFGEEVFFFIVQGGGFFEVLFFGGDFFLFVYGGDFFVEFVQFGWVGQD